MVYWWGGCSLGLGVVMFGEIIRGIQSRDGKSDFRTPSSEMICRFCILGIAHTGATLLTRQTINTIPHYIALLVVSWRL